MESHKPAKSMLASFLTFQFLCNNRSSHGNFFASFNNFSSSDIVSLTIYTYTLSISVMQISFPLSFLLFDCLRFFLTPIAGERRGGGEGNDKTRILRDAYDMFYHAQNQKNQKREKSGGILGCTFRMSEIPKRFVWFP